MTIADICLALALHQLQFALACSVSMLSFSRRHTSASHHHVGQAMSNQHTYMYTYVQASHAQPLMSLCLCLCDVYRLCTATAYAMILRQLGLCTLMRPLTTAPACEALTVSTCNIVASGCARAHMVHWCSTRADLCFHICRVGSSNM